MSEKEILVALYEDMQEVKGSLKRVEEQVKENREEIAKNREEIAKNRKAIEKNCESINKLEDRVTSIDVTMENVVGPNIKIIAEGHLDLNRKLDEALKISNEREIIKIRINGLEDELRKLKAHIGLTA